jgi:hypothetical protein
MFAGYLETTIAKQVPFHAATMCEDHSEDVQEEVAEAAKTWSHAHIVAVRRRLVRQFGKPARGVYEEFVDAFIEHESKNDLGYLEKLCGALGLEEPHPTSYADLRARIVEEDLQGVVKEGGDLLGEIQSWLALFDRDERNIPSLLAWLDRNSIAAPFDPLRRAEAPLEPYEDYEEEEGTFLESMTSLYEEKQKRMVAEAEEGMRAVAAEREAAEREAAEKKLEAAKRDAEAVKRHAQKLAATQEEIIKQRQRSWSARLKRIAGALISSTTGAFTGGIGERAAEEAVNDLFD